MQQDLQYKYTLFFTSKIPDSEKTGILRFYEGFQFWKYFQRLI